MGPCPVADDRYYYVSGYWTYNLGSALYAYKGNTGAGLVGAANATYQLPGTGPVRLHRLY